MYTNLKNSINVLTQVLDATVIKGGVLNTNDVILAHNSLASLRQHVQELENPLLVEEKEVETTKAKK